MPRVGLTAVARLLAGGVCFGSGQAFADLRERQVGGELGAGEPDGLSCGVDVTIEGDLVAADVTGGEALDVDEDTGAGEHSEELRGIDGHRRSGTDGSAQALTGGGLVAGAVGLFLFGAGGALGSGAVTADDAVEAVFLLHGSKLAVGGQVVVPVASRAQGTGPHALRHHYASLLIKHGESVKTVSERLGHTNAAMTLNIYTHLWPDSEERTRAAVDKAYADRTDRDEPQAEAAA